MRRSTRHDEEEGGGDKDESEEISGKGDFEGRHAETLSISPVSFIQSRRSTVTYADPHHQSASPTQIPNTRIRLCHVCIGAD